MKNEDRLFVLNKEYDALVSNEFYAEAEALVGEIEKLEDLILN